MMFICKWMSNIENMPNLPRYLGSPKQKIISVRVESDFVEDLMWPKDLFTVSIFDKNWSKKQPQFIKSFEQLGDAEIYVLDMLDLLLIKNSLIKPPLITVDKLTQLHDKVRGQDLKDFRKKLEITTEELGNLLGVSRRTINDWERDRQYMKSTYQKLFQYLVLDYEKKI